MIEFPGLLEAALHKLKGLRLIIILLVLFIVILGLTIRAVSYYNLKAAQSDQSIPTVSVLHPSTSGAEKKIVLPGTVEAWSQAQLYARTNGYLKAWHADIGKTVKAGELLAEIDTPDVDQQVAVAKANLAMAEAQLKLAESTAKRWENLLVNNAVSKQEADDKRGDLAVKQMAVSAASAELHRLQTMLEFSRIVAPFDGTITSRVADIGSLIVAGNAAEKPIFTVADVSRMRVYVNVPQNYIEDITPDIKANLVLPESPDRKLELSLANVAESISKSSGTMLTQFIADNSSGVLKPGSYVQVDILLLRTKQAVRIPASALLFRPEGMMVMTVDTDGRIKITPIRIAHDYGAEIEIESGLAVNDLVVDSPPDALANGDQVRLLRQ